MIASAVQHWVAMAVCFVVLAVVLRGLLQPPSWQDGEGDNCGLVDIGSFEQLH